MLSFPNAKINLGLNVVSKRPDGYHNIESVFYPIPWSDSLEIIESKTIKFSSTGLDIPGNPESNLCLKAYNLLKEKFDIPPVHIHLHKIIPMGAGLGGGSSDGAFTLKMLNEQFTLNLSDNELELLAGQLGSDCPFFIKNKPVFVSGTGNEFKTINLNLSGKTIVLKNPGIHIGTKEAYAGITPKSSQVTITDIISQSVSTWKEVLKNDFESSIFPNHPDILQLKESLYQVGAAYASMTGSGSTVYGIFDHTPDFDNGYKIFQLS